MLSAPDELRDFRVVLRHTFASGSVATEQSSPPEFTAIVSATDENGAQGQADALVASLKNYVRVVSITGM